MASANWMTRASATDYRMRSVRALFLPDAECQGKSPLDDAGHGICLSDDARHGVCLADDEYQGIIPSGRRVLRLISSRRRMPRHLPSGRRALWRPPSGRAVSGSFSFQTQSVKANDLQTTCATASVFRTRSVKAFFLPDAARVLQMHIVKANVVRMACATASTFRTRSVSALSF